MGDFDGDGRLDLMSGSNCCDPGGSHLFLRKLDGSFSAREEVRFDTSDFHAFMRGTTRPHLVDWNRDGQTDLVVGHPGMKRLRVGFGPLAGKKDVAVKLVRLPALPGERSPNDDLVYDRGASLVHFEFADWDGDGRFDLLVALVHTEAKGKGKGFSYSYSLHWFRNTAEKGEPTFAPAIPLLTIPSAWQLNAFSVIDWGQNGHLDLVVSMTKDWKQKKGGHWTVDSQLWLYRQK